jgi:hypothetical protein
MDQEAAIDEAPDRPKALERFNSAIRREGFEAFYGKRPARGEYRPSIFLAIPYRLMRYRVLLIR